MDAIDRRAAVRRHAAAWLVAALLGLAAWLPGCGGVGSGGTGSFAAGPITGYGSIVVGQVHFDESSAEILGEDGAMLASSQLALGMTVQVQAGELVNGEARAWRVVVASELIGRVDAVQSASGRLTVNGVTVRTHEGTVFDAAFAGALASVPVGQIVEVWGLADTGTGEVSATRIAPRSNVTSYQFRGEVAALDRSLKRFSLGSQTFDYSGLPVTPPGLGNGAWVRVAVDTGPSGPKRWTVQSLVNAARPQGDVESVAVNGLVSRFASLGDFTVDGVPINATQATVAGGTPARGERVAVQGSLRAGVLWANRVMVVPERGDDAFEMRGVIASVDAAAKVFSLTGRREPISYAGPGVVYQDGSEAAIAPGRRVKARGTLSTDGTRLQASTIEFEDD